VADATAITGIIVSGIVGPSLAAWWARSLARSQDRRNRESDDLKELRVLLDEALGHFDALLRYYSDFSNAWYEREERSNRDTEAAMSTAYAALEGTALALLEMNARFDARLGPEHQLSGGFEKLRDEAWELVKTPGGVAMAFDEMSREQRNRVRELSQGELALFVARRREWIMESLPLAGLRIPAIERRESVAAPAAARADAKN
jgi:hypothetical protein